MKKDGCHVVSCTRLQMAPVAHRWPALTQSLARHNWALCRQKVLVAGPGMFIHNLAGFSQWALRVDGNISQKNRTGSGASEKHVRCLRARALPPDEEVMISMNMRTNTMFEYFTRNACGRHRVKIFGQKTRELEPSLFPGTLFTRLSLLAEASEWEPA